MQLNWYNINIYAVSMWMEHLLESSRTKNQWACHSRKTNKWECTLAYGTLRTGPPGAVRSRPTGPRRPSQPVIATSAPMDAPRQTLMRVLRQTTPGCINRWIQWGNKGWCGPRKTIWFTTIVLMLGGFHKGCHLSAVPISFIIIIERWNKLPPVWALCAYGKNTKSCIIKVCSVL